MNLKNQDQLSDKQCDPDVLKGIDGIYGANWRGTFEMWQNPVFGALYEKHCHQKRIFIGDIQAFISSRPLIGNLTLKVYCLPHKRPVSEIISAAAKFNVAHLWIYSVNEIPELQENLEETAHTFIIDLRRETDLLWANMGSKTRNMVRKGEKKGVLVKEAENEQEFNKWWEVYLNTATTKEFEIQSYDLVSTLFRDPSLSRLFISLVDGQVAGGFFFVVNNYPMYWLGAFDRKFLEWSPSNLCIWKSVLWFNENGFPLLDLGGAVTDRDHGPTQFKKNLGGRLADAYIYNVPVQGIKNSLLGTIRKFYGKF
jgi:hypothetical protein